MVAPIRTWTISINNSFSDQSDQALQFRESCFAFKQLLVAAGWTVSRSSDGATVDATDNWATSADVTFGSSGNGSWVVLRSPVDWIQDSEQIELLLYVNETNSGNTPQTAPIRIAPGGYTGGAASVAATGSIDCDNAGSAVVVLDTETVVIDDGPNAAVTFEFDDDDSVVETDTLRKVDISAAADDDDVRDALIAAVTAAPVFNMIAVSGGAGLVSLTSTTRGTVGNVAITNTVVSGNFATTGMSGGANGSLPAATGNQTSVITAGDDMIPWSSLAAGRYSTWYTSRGDIMFGVKREGKGLFAHFIMLTSNEDDNGGGAGNQRWQYYAASSNTANALLWTTLSATGNHKGTDPAGSNTIMAISAQCTAWLATGTWTDGLDQQGETNDVSIDLWHNGAAAVGPRYYGQLIDFYGAPITLPFGALDDSERSQTQRRVCMGDGVWLYAPAASLPFE